MMISIILPAYNEEGYIKKNTLALKREIEKMPGGYEIIIIEESSDKTPQIAEELSRRYKKIRHFHFAKRLGKGKAIEYGIRNSRGEKIVFMDVDLAVDLSALPSMAAELDKYDVVVGSRYHPLSKTKRTFLRLLLGRSYSFLPRIILRIGVDDPQCGFKGFRRRAAMKIIKHTRFSGVFWDTEILFLSKKFGFAIKEIPLRWEEKKGRSTKIGIKTIYKFALSVIILFFRDLLERKQN